MPVISVSKAEMLSRFGFPYFGYTQFKGAKIPPDVYICADLPQRVQNSVLVHETQHVKDNAFLDGRVWHWEIRAWKAQAKADFVGMLYTIWLTIIDKDRVKLYLNRIKGGF